ncbi:transcriptional regulator with XRE-family HTH domain [Sphingomonas insulae]|uniref:DNA N-6-adenine-methyltransferase n=1 Tax=Sphingomonas insulae TaxID=424800 RepID=UPI0013D4D45F|nr:DNA N-6-adenine-methyltransferase [Sphingomonas insulae]NIJ31627.1 transcriptional regulator with XRE-family HTH domain [Sphingomonas insulae]
MLLQYLREARNRKGLTREQLAATIQVDVQSIKRLEVGIGNVPTLVATMVALDLHLAGVGHAASLPQQLRAARIRRKWSLPDLGKRAGLSPATIAAVEGGQGTVASALKMLRALAPDARPRQPSTRAFWALDPLTERDVRFTPPEFLERVYTAFGIPDLDPCGHAQSPVLAGRKITLADGGDGLTDDWSGDFAYVNPPFSGLLRWLRRAEDQVRCGNVRKVVALVPARLDAPYYHTTLRHHADIWILRGRLSFGTLSGKGNQAPFALMVVMFGVTEHEIDAFTKTVPGAWFAPRRERPDHWPSIA